MRLNCARLSAFTCREQEVIDGLMAGKQIKEIASDLGLSVHTVKDYAKAIYRKAAVQSSRELVARFFEDWRSGAECEHIETLLAMSDAHSPSQSLAICVKALKVWTGARDAVTIEVCEETNPQYPSDARGLSSRGGAMAISPELAHAEPLLRRHLNGKVVRGRPILAALRIQSRHWLVLLLDADEKRFDPVAIAAILVTMAEHHQIPIAAVAGTA